MSVTVLVGAQVPALESFTVERLAHGLDHVRLVLRFPNLPACFDGLVIGHLTDLHFPARSALAKAVIDWAGSQAVDLWAVTGDLLEHPNGMDAVQRLARVLQAPLGVFAVAGNNDNRIFDTQGGASQAFRALGMTPLENQGLRLPKGSGHLALAGVDDPTRFRDDLAAALWGFEEEDFVLLLAHSPGIVFREGPFRPSLVLAGHTHGGQICAPWVGALVARTRQPGCGRRMAAGLFERLGTVVYVSRGIGTSILPLRILCRPEVTTVTLLRGGDS